MEIVLVLALLIITVIFLVRLSNKDRREETTLTPMNRLVTEILELKKEIKQLRQEVNKNTEELQQRLPSKWDAPREAEKPREWFAETKLPEPDPESMPVIATVFEPEEVKPVESLDVLEPEVAENETTEIEIEVQETIFADTEVLPGFTPRPPKDLSSSEQTPPPPPYEPEPSKFDTWLSNNQDLEKFIGENLINKIGIAILVLGIAFFVKYAIDKDWINEVGRVCIGFVCGGILVALAHYLHKNYRSFSSVLAGGGIAVFYFTIAFGFHQYHLMSQTAAFVVMVGITAFAIALSVLYNRLELAIIATVGGFLAPFLVSTGEGNYVVLFTYLIILDIGILLLAYYKRWPAINIIALVFTELIYGGWLNTVLNNPAKQISYPVALLFATVFYFIFIGMNMVHQVKNRVQFKPLDFTILLVISSSYFGAGLTLLHYWNSGAYQGLFTLALGFVNLGMAYFVYKNGKADRNLLFLLIGITLTFITLTIPIQLHGHAITLFWSVEFVLLYWLSEYSGIRLFKYSSMLICLCTLASLFMDWEQASLPGATGLLVIYSNIQGIVTNVVVIASFWALYFLIRKNEEGEIAGFETKLVGRMALTVAVALLYVTCMFGVNLYFRTDLNYIVPNVYHRLITEIFALLLVAAFQKKRPDVSPWLPFAALIICFILFLGSTESIIDLRNLTLAGKIGWLHFCIQWVDSILLGILLYRAIAVIRNNYDVFVNAIKALSVVITVMAITLVSLELMHIFVIIGYNNSNTSLLESQYSKAGLTVIWAMSSFALMWLGMKYREKTLRIISLVLFSVVLIKLVLIDIRNISEGGKILTFILLGVLLLIVSFMYQKLKKIIINDKQD